MTTPSWSFTIAGAPRTKKTSQRVLRFGKFNKIVPSKAYLEWRDHVLPQLRRAWRDRPLTELVHVCAVFFRDAERGDLVGYMQGLADVLQEARLLDDDKLIRNWDGTRLAKDADRPRVEFTMTIMPSSQLELTERA